MLTLNQIKSIVLPILENYPIGKAGVFGSFARGEARKGSDLDILVEFEEEVGLLTMVELQFALEDALGIPVDVVEYQSIKPLLKKHILADEILLFDKREAGVLVS